MEELLKEDRIREEIVDAAMGLFQKYGLKKTSMGEIAEGAGKGKSTLYYYFKDKDDLFLAVLDRECGNMKARLSDAVRKETGIEGKLRAYLKAKVSMISEYDIFHDLVKDMITGKAKRFEEFMHTFEAFELNLLTNCLEEAKDFQQLHGHIANNISFTAQCMSKVLKGIYMQTMLENSFEQFEQNLQHIITLLLHGVLKRNQSSI